VAPQDPNPFADWSANLFMAGATPHMIMTNTASLYLLVVPARGMNDERAFVRQILSSLQEMLVADGLQALHEQFIVPVMGTQEFSKSLNRSVSGSMNDLVVQAKSHLIGNPLPLLVASRRMNEAPMGAIQYENPRSTLIRLAESQVPRTD
ncbi:MAG: hypothetical protein JSS02_05270, partial [Planctomycetes bacterium]|nr:hypothetical protein [Planctomycetota bacterium]